MADITLHSGSFCDRNNDEITITFFKRSSTPVMTVDPTELSYTSNGGTKTLRVSNYTGTLSISVSGGTGWLGYTQSTSSGVRTYTFTATANNTTSLRNAVITLTDNNNTVTVGVTQAGATSFVEVNPNYLVFNSNGETKTTTVTWSGGSTPTWSNAPEWASITSSVSGGTMTLTINVGVNTTQYQRTGTVYVSNGISRADLALEQSATHTVAVSPSSFTFTAAGGTQELTITNIEGSFSMNYQGDFLTLEPTYTSSTIRKYNVVCSANPVREQRTGVINVKDTAGDWVAVPVTQAANSDTFAVSPTSFEYAGSGSTNTFTFTGSPSVIAYNIPEGIDWVTVSNLSTSSVDITTSANQTPNSRTTTVMFYNDFDMSERVFVTVNQEAGVESLSVVPTSITYLPAGGTYGITATWTAGTEPTATITYVQGESGWMTPTGSGTVTGNTKEWSWTASPNNTGSSRTALITVTNGLQSQQVTVVQSALPPQFSVSPTSFEYAGSGASNTFNFSNAPASISYTIPSGIDWVTVSNLSSTSVDITASANNTINPRTTTVRFYNTNDSSEYVDVTVNQEEGVSSLEVTPSSITYMPRGSTSGITATWTGGTEPTATITYVQGEGGWMTPTGSGTVTGNTKEWAWTAAANNTTGSRTALITVTNGIQSAQVTVVQSKVDKMTVTPNSLQFTSSAGENYVTITKYFSGLPSYDTVPAWASVTLTATSNSKVRVDISVLKNSTENIRTETIRFYDSGNTGDYVDVTITQEASSALSVTPSSISVSYIFQRAFNVKLSNVVGDISTSKSANWITLLQLYNTGGEAMYRVGLVRNIDYVQRSGSATFTDENSTVSLPITQGSNNVMNNPMTASASSVTFNASDINVTQAVRFYNVDTELVLPSVSESWFSLSSGSRIDETTWDLNVNCNASNTSTSSRNATVEISDYYSRGPVTLAITQLGTGGGSGISVSPSELNFSYTSGSDTLTVSGVSGYNTSLSYTGASGWLSVLSNANTITVSASGTTYPSSRTATLTVTNASDATDSVAIPISQAGNPRVLSVTPNAWNYPSSLSYHEFTVTYVSTGTIDYTVAYDREEGEEEIDWLAVELVDHEEGTETWIYSIDVGPNNTGSGRAAMVTFEGNGGGADEVSVYQQP